MVNCNNELRHYGVLGMKWGIRRYQNKEGSLILPKGSIVKRVSLTREDPTYDNKKYVSINQNDHLKWEKYIGEAYIKRNKKTFSQTYITTKDLNIMSKIKQGELYMKMLLDPNFKIQSEMDTARSNTALGLEPSKDASENISRNIAMQTNTGKSFIEKVLENNYDAIVDVHGSNVSKDPLIVLNPDINLKKKIDPELTKPVKDFLKCNNISV